MPRTDIRLEPTERSPRVVLDVENRRLSISGESYPEDAAAFFGPLLQSVGSFLEAVGTQDVHVDVQLVYFNSSSAKALMNLFQMLENAAAGGATVAINWHYHIDDDIMEEFGQDFSEDFRHARFDLHPVSGDR